MLIDWRSSSEYSNSGSDSKPPQSRFADNFTVDEKSKGRSKVYGLLLSDPYSLASFIPTLICGAVPVFTFLFLGNILNDLWYWSKGELEDPMPDVSQQCLYMLYITLAVVVMKFFSNNCSPLLKDSYSPFSSIAEVGCSNAFEVDSEVVPKSPPV